MVEVGLYYLCTERSEFEGNWFGGVTCDGADAIEV
jgi:hypothetical protein